jgi:LPS export ABC transporter permease LptF/LPS export ABC transporter permease LptG
MRILDRYIVREVFRHALLGLVVFTFVFFVPQLVRLMELFVRHSGSGAQILTLFLCIFPAVFVFTVPMATLIGVLLGLGRMSADSEIIALTALGIGRRRILLPVGVLALAGAVVTLTMTTWLGPTALRTFRTLQADMITSQVSFAVQPRVFDERFPRMVLFVNDVAASGTQWHGVFLAQAGGESGSQLTLSERAIVIAEPRLGKLELHLQGGTTHEFSREDADHYSVTAFGQSDWPIEFNGLANAEPRQLNNSERSVRELLHDNGPGWREARVELHRRFAFPIACFAFALIAVPLGAQPRRGGRAAGALLAVILIAGYYLLTVLGAGLAREGAVRPATGIWMANVVIFALGIILLPRMEQFRGETWWFRPILYFQSRRRLLRRRRAQARANARAVTANGGNGERQAQEVSTRSSGSFPQLLDIYLLRRFFYYFALLMGAFVFLFETFTFFELLDDIARHRVPFLIVVDYFRYLAPYLLYQLAPLGALVAVLVTIGIMSKNNEIVAIKASGISMYRLAVPLLLGGLALAVTMIVLDDTYLPYANQRQDAFHNIIKGRPPQTYTHPQRWIFGEASKIYNYDLFDPTQNLFGGLTVLEIDPATFQLRRRIYASRARWSQTQKVWVLEGSWVRDFADGAIVRYDRLPPVTSLPELTEPPSYFNREVRQAFQMSWRELRVYIDGLQRAGFDVSTLTVQWHEKIAFPLLAPVSMLLAIPFALLVGTRGAVGGVALGVAFGIAYWSVAKLLEAMGGVGQLPPFLAGWAPDIIFFFMGLYFFFKMPT